MPKWGPPTTKTGERHHVRRPILPTHSVAGGREGVHTGERGLEQPDRCVKQFRAELIILAGARVTLNVPSKAQEAVTQRPSHGRPE